ncbi:hypothetical protein ACFL2K_05045, partial [Candidatus Margulisiibacteriota bacterium]
FVQNNFTEKLNILEQRRNADVIITPWKFLSLKGGKKYVNIDQKQDTGTALITSDINQDISVGGIIIRPIKYMECSVDGLAKYIRYKSNNSSQNGSSTGIIVKFKYTPKITQNFTAKILFDAEYTKGYDLNEIEREATLQGSQQEAVWTPQERNDLKLLGTVSVDLEIPLPSVQYAEKFVLTASGKVKVVSDRINSQNSYNLSGVVISGKILF